MEQQGITNSAWAVAQCCWDDAPLLDSLAAASIPTCRYSQGGVTLGIKNSSWSLAALQFYHGPLLDSIAASAIRNSSAATFRVIARTAWSIAPRQFSHQPCIHAISAASIKIIQGAPADSELMTHSGMHHHIKFDT